MESVYENAAFMIITLSGENNSFAGSFDFRLSLYRANEIITSYIPYDKYAQSHYMNTVDKLEDKVNNLENNSATVTYVTNAIDNALEVIANGSY